MKRRRTAGGFSLVELLVAMALVAIVAAIAVPQFQRYATNADLKTAAREVASDFFNTRQQALKGELAPGEVKKDLEYRLTFNVGGNSYALETRETTAAPWNTEWTKSLASFGGGITIHSINFSGGSIVNFQKRGTVSAGNLILKNRLGSKAEITVNMAGRTYVQFTMQ